MGPKDKPWHARNLSPLAFRPRKADFRISVFIDDPTLNLYTSLNYKAGDLFRRKDSTMFRCRSVIWMLLVLILPILCSGLPASYAIDVGGTIDDDTTWIPAESPYMVVGNIKISAGATLTIQPGVTVMFQENIRAETGFYIRVDGTLTAQGTATAPIVFTSENKAFRWGGIVYMDISKDWDEDTSTGCIIDHCIIEYAGNSTIYGTAAITTFSAQPYLANSTIRYTPSIGIAATDILFAQSPSGQLRIVANHIHNHAEGIRLAVEGALIENNYFIDNSQAMVIQTSSNNIIVRNNTIVNTQRDIQGDGINVSLDDDDNDNGIAGYAWEQTSGLPIELDNPRSPLATFIAPDVGASVETLVFDLMVTDDGGQTDTESLEIKVFGTNEPPVANAGADQNVQQGLNTVLNAAGSFDPDYGIKSYQWEQIEGTGVTLDSTTAINPSFSAPTDVPNEGETLTFQVTVKDTGDQEDTDTVDVRVYKVNIPPLANAGGDIYAASGVVVQLDGSGSVDPDGSIASYAWVQTEGTPVTLDGSDTARPSFLGPDAGPLGEELIFEMTVEDTGTPRIESSDTITVTVFEDNIPPFAVPGNSLKVFQGETARLLAFNSYDPDPRSDVTIENNLLSSAAQTAGLINISLAVVDAVYDVNIIANQFEAISDDGLAIYLYSWPPGITDPDIRVSDNWYGSDDAEVIEQLVFDGKDDFILPEIEVNPALEVPDTVGSALTYPPLANAGPDTSTPTDVEVTLDGSGTYDPENIATYAWTQLDGPVVQLKNPASTSASFIAPLGGNEGQTLTFQLRVSIEGAFYDTDKAVVNVVPDENPSTVEKGDFLGCFINSIQ
jgi:hypothetical protein